MWVGPSDRGKGKGRGPGGPRPALMSLAWSLLLLVLEPGEEHLLGALGGLKVVLEDAVEEVHQFLVALLLSVLDVGLQGLDIVGRMVEHGDEVVVLIFGLPGCFGHLPSRGWVAWPTPYPYPAAPQTRRVLEPEGPLTPHFGGLPHGELRGTPLLRRTVDRAAKLEGLAPLCPPVQPVSYQEHHGGDDDHLEDALDVMPPD